MSLPLLTPLIKPVKSIQRIPKPQRPGVTYYSVFDTWQFHSVFDARRCERCEQYETAEYWRGDQLRLEFPDHEVEDEETIRANVHPHCRCTLVRVID